MRTVLRQRDRRALDRRLRGEQGAATAMVLLVAGALFVVAGLVIDGGYALAAKREALNTAEQAARAGSDALSKPALLAGETRVDPAAARRAARDYLGRAGARGSVSVAGGEVTVTVTRASDTTLLSAVGVTAIPVSASASAVSIEEGDARGTGVRR